MKILLSLFEIIVLLYTFSTKALAYDGSVTISGGQTLYYYQGYDQTIWITYPGNDETNPWYGYAEPSGAITIPDSIAHNGINRPVVGILNYCFGNCHNITSVTIPDGVTYLGDWAFWACSRLTSITIGNGITSIRTGAFRSCSSLSTVIMGAGVNSIDMLAFADCYKITTVTIGDNTLTVSSNDTTLGKACINFPIASDWNHSLYPWAYSIANHHHVVWSDGCTTESDHIILSDNISLTADFVLDQYSITLLSNDENLGSVQGGGTYDYLDAISLVATAAEHHHFVRWDDGNTDNPRQYVVIGDTVLTAIFAIDTLHVSVMSNNIAYGNATGDGDFEYGTPATVTAIAYSGYRFARWSNGDTHNPYTFAVLQDMELTAIFEDENEGVEDVESINAKVYAHNGKIVVENVGGNDVSLYDMNGRIVQEIKQSGNQTICLDVPASGTYMIKIGDHPARKVVVVR